MSILVASKNEAEDGWLFRGVFGSKQKAKDALTEVNDSYFYCEIANDRAYPNGITLDNMKEFK